MTTLPTIYYFAFLLACAPGSPDDCGSYSAQAATLTDCERALEAAATAVDPRRRVYHAECQLHPVDDPAGPAWTPPLPTEKPSPPFLLPREKPTP